MTADVHEQAPDDVWALFKKCRKFSTEPGDDASHVIDFARGLTVDQENQFTCTQWCDEEKLVHAIRDFLQIKDPALGGSDDSGFAGNGTPTSSMAYAHATIPGGLLRVN